MRCFVGRKSCGAGAGVSLVFNGCGHAQRCWGVGGGGGAGVGVAFAVVEVEGMGAGVSLLKLEGRGGFVVGVKGRALAGCF
jgi:hypothetical protein